MAAKKAKAPDPKRSAAMKRAWDKRRANGHGKGVTLSRSSVRRGSAKGGVLAAAWRTAEKMKAALNALPPAMREAVLDHLAER